jgi:tetratricopeptide (TPR) repeat protein
MNQLCLKKAVSEIHQIVDQEERSPFFFIVGAGISAPEVPLAGDIEKHCRERAKKYYETPDLPTGRPMMERYSHWFQRGYTSARTRRKYLDSIMSTVSISRANDKLARILVADKVARTVFTTNFDEMLSKALELYGERPLVCDHPQTVSRMNIESEKLQIIHVHGSFWFYDCCNLQNEISARSGNAPMLRTLSQALANYSPLVVGYSGWEGDILMTSLKERLAVGALGTPIYWFCYRRSDIEELPPWLKASDDVNFVVPDEQVSAASQMPQDLKQASGTEDGSVGTPASWESGKQSARPTLGTSGPEVLPADVVFAEIIEQLELPVPPLMRNPLDFFYERLRALDTAERSLAASDDYNFKEVIKRVKTARDSEKRVGPDSLVPFRAAMSKSDYRKAIEEARGVDFYSLPMGDRREALFALKEAAHGLYDNTPEEIEGYEDVVKLADLLSDQDQADSATRIQVSDALYCWAMTLKALSRRQEAVATYDKLAQRFAHAGEPEIRQQVAKALFNKGLLLNLMDRNEESLRPYTELQARFDHDTDPVIVENIATAMYNKGWSLVALKRYAEGVAAYTDLIERYTAAPEAALREQVAKSLLNRGIARSSLGESVEEMADYDELVHRFKDSPEPGLREQVAKGMNLKGATLASLKDPQGAIDMYDQVVAQFGTAEELGLREQVAKALLSKGYTLGTMNRSDEEMEVYAELLERFDAASETVLQEQVARASFNRGATMIELSKPEEALPIYAALVERFADSPEPAIREQVAKALLSGSQLYENAAQTERAARLCEEIIARFDNGEDQALSDYVERARTKLGDLAKAAKSAVAQPEIAVSTGR